jgi:hypothetical protein
MSQDDLTFFVEFSFLNWLQREGLANDELILKFSWNFWVCQGTPGTPAGSAHAT